MRPWMTGFLGLAAASALTLAACGDDAPADVGASAAPQGDVSQSEPVIDPGDGGAYAVDLDPADFVAGIDHPFLPFVPGARWVYESSDGVERIEVEVLATTREILGITATVVHDRVWEDGELIEDTFDWYAQDQAGNVWYLGEDSSELEDGEVVSRAGSWEAGVDGAVPGIVMLAEPTPGEAYRQEYYAGEAEDLAEVVRLDGVASVVLDDFDGVLVMREWTPLEPAVVEEKYYARGVGVVLEQKVAGEEGRVELVEYEPGS